MSLRAFHVVFIALSTLMSFVVGLWGLQDYARQGSAGGLGLGLLCFALGVVLVIYGVKVYKKLWALESS